MSEHKSRLDRAMAASKTLPPPIRMKDDTGREGYVGTCRDCLRENVQVIGCSCSKESEPYICLRCYWTAWR